MAKPKRNSKGQFTKSTGITVNRADVKADMTFLGPSNFNERITAMMVANTVASRASLLNKLIDPRRNIDEECGYPTTRDLDRDQYKDLFERDPIANRVVGVLPDETWRCPVSVFETEDQDKTTPFEMAWDQLGRSLKGDSWHQDEEGNIIWETLARADVMSGIGHFGVILIGIDDGLELEQPIDGIDENGKSKYAMEKKTDLTFVDEDGNEVTEQDLLAREQQEALEGEEGAVPGQPPSKGAADGGADTVAPAGADTKGLPPGSNPKPKPEEEDAQTFNAAMRELVGNNCGVGQGGFQPGNSCASGGGDGGGSVDIGLRDKIANGLKSIMKTKKSTVGHGSHMETHHAVTVGGKEIAVIKEVNYGEHISQGGGIGKTVKVKLSNGKDLGGSFKNVADAKHALAVHKATIKLKKQSPTANALPEEEDEDDDESMAPRDAQEGEDTGLPQREFAEEEAGDPNDEYTPKGMGTADLYDGTSLQPRKKANLGDRKLLFLRVFDESLVQITRYETRKESPRYGLPVEYNITMHDPHDNQQTGTGIDMGVKKVHWHRVIHLADNRGNSEWSGVPRMRPVLNRLIDLKKVYGGSAEGYWKTCVPIYTLETHPQLGGDVAMDADDVKDQIEHIENGLSRWMSIAGVSLKSTGPTVGDPTATIDKHIEGICIQLGIPVRIFMGSERGELASSQDDSTWNDRLGHRQDKYVTPKVIVPFVDRLIAAGVLPAPTGYSVRWQPLDALSRKEKAEAAVAETNAMGAYISGGVEAMMSPEDYLVRVMGFTPDEAIAILDASAEAEPLAPAAGQETFDAQGNPIDPMTGQPTKPAGMFGEGGEAPLTAEDLGTDAEGRAEQGKQMAEKGVVVAQPQAGPPVPGQPGKPPTGKKPPFPPKKGKPPVTNAAPLVLDDEKFNLVANLYIPAGIDVNLVSRVFDKTNGKTYVRKAAGQEAA